MVGVVGVVVWCLTVEITRVPLLDETDTEHSSFTTPTRTLVLRKGRWTKVERTRGTGTLRNYLEE